MKRPDLRLVADAQLMAMTLLLGIEHFLTRKAARGARPNTLRAYRSDLAQFATFVRWLDRIELVALMSQRHVSRWLDDLNAKGASTRTQARKLTVLRTFVKHAQREGWLAHDPTRDEQVRFRARRVIAPELEALHGIVDAIPTRTVADVRDRAMLRLAIDCGLRISEVATADMPGASEFSVDIPRQLVRVMGKGGDTESVPFNERTARMLADWLQVRHELAEPGEIALFVSGKGKRFARQGLHVMFKRRAKVVGLGDAHWHLMRHRRIAQIVETLGTKVAQQFARHASESTTALYGKHADSIAHALLRERADIDQGRAIA